MTHKEEHDAYIAKLRAAGRALASYQCPHCKNEIFTLAAPAGERWDSLASCPHCPELHFKYTVGDFAHATAFPVLK